MSKLMINLLDHLKAPLEEGHVIKKHTVNGPEIYCPKYKDQTLASYTSLGILCNCGIHFTNDHVNKS